MLNSTPLLPKILTLVFGSGAVIPDRVMIGLFVISTGFGAITVPKTN